MDLGVVTNGCGTDRVNNRATKIFAIGDGSIRGKAGEVLFSKSQDFSLGSKECEFVFACTGQRGELYALTGFSTLNASHKVEGGRPLISVPVLGVI